MKHVIITPAKNEEQFIEKTIISICNQTLLPSEWIIVDDGSTDKTVEIVNKYIKNFPFISLIILETQEKLRAGGANVVLAFNEGVKHLKDHNYDFITKLDADLTLPKNYFEKISEAFNCDRKLGICGGICYIEKDGKLVKERADFYHVRGALKSLKKKCYEEIGGFKPVLHWDGIDEYTARYLGWKVKSINIQVIHHRPTSQAYNPLKFNFKNGYAARQRRASLFLSFLRAIFKMRTSPYILNSFAYFTGFIWAIIKGEKSVIDKKISHSMNKFDMMKIFRKKKFKKQYYN